VFRFDEGAHEDTYHDRRSLVDPERDVWFQRVSGLGRREQLPIGACFKLVWGDRVIPFDAIRQNAVDPATDSTFLLVEIETFGESQCARIDAGIPSFAFRDEAEKRAAKLLAAEALLVFGAIYNGDKYPDGRIRVRIKEGDTSTDYRLSSFGYSDSTNWRRNAESGAETREN
jgi:hypothetical protein